MTKEELLQAVRDGRVLSTDYGDEDDWMREQPEHYLMTVLANEDAQFDGIDIEYLERTVPAREYYDENIDGRDMKLVFKVEDTVFVAIGHYDSWEGEHFPDGFFEAELVDVPTWLPKK